MQINYYYYFFHRKCCCALIYVLNKTPAECSKKMQSTFACIKQFINISNENVNLYLLIYSGGKYNMNIKK